MRRYLIAISVVIAVGASACVPVPPAQAQTTVTLPSATWVKFSADTLDLFSPDTNSLYYTDAYVTSDGIRTVITGRAPSARYWSFVVYKTQTHPLASVYDAQVRVVHGQYRITIASTCAGVTGTCLTTTSADQLGFVVYRLYVPDDLDGAQTGDVPLPSLTYVDPSGSGAVNLSDVALPAAANAAVDNAEFAAGGSVAAVLATDPTDGPVPSPSAAHPTGNVGDSSGGPFSNPDNVYFHIPYRDSRGDLLITAQAPTYRAQSPHPANALGRTNHTEQVRYWSLCTVAQGKLTIECLRDEQVVIPRGKADFVLVVAPRCPVAGYANCLPAGLSSLQWQVVYRALLPSPHFVPYEGAFAVASRYVSRSG